MVMKLRMISIIVSAVISGVIEEFPNILRTELNKIIATASLTIPSPNTIENNFGYFFGLIIVRAATESVAQIVAEKSKVRVVPNENVRPSLEFTINPKIIKFYTCCVNSKS